MGLIASASPQLLHIRFTRPAHVRSGISRLLPVGVA